jgi:hypothetical protein
MPEIVVLLLIGFAAGIASGMFGIGGGAIIVPLLVILLGYSQVAANGTSLVALLLPVGIFACWTYYRAGKLRPRIALACALGLALGFWFGARIALGIEPRVLEVLYGLFLLYNFWRSAAPRQWYAEWRGREIPKKAQTDPIYPLDDPRVLWVCVGVGAIAGVAGGMFGIGGGVVIVVALDILLKFDQKLATGTSLGALLLPVGLPAVLEYYAQGQLNITSAIPLALMLVVGSLIGANVALGLSDKTIKRIYGLFLLMVSFRFLFITV